MLHGVETNSTDVGGKNPGLKLIEERGRAPANFGGEVNPGRGGVNPADRPPYTRTSAIDTGL